MAKRVETPEAKQARLDKARITVANKKLQQSQDSDVDVMEQLDIPEHIIQQPRSIPAISKTTIAESKNTNAITKPILNEIRGRIAIKPYISGEENMGLERDDQPGGAMVVFPDITQRDQIGCKVDNGYATYFTGLNENAPAVQTLPEAKKIARITTIRQVVAYLENSIASNFKVRVESCMDNYGTKEDHFWENVTTFNSAGPQQFDQRGNLKATYWDSVKVDLTNATKLLDKSNPHDLVIYYAIQASGLSMIAPSLSAAMNAQGAYKWYLDQPEETADIQTEHIKLKYQAGAALEQMRLNDENRLFLLAKLTPLSGSSQYRRGGPNYTPVNSMYKDLSDYIEGRKGEGTITATEKFLDLYKMPIDELMRRAVLRDATEKHMIDTKGDGRTYYKNEPLGKTIDEIVAHLNSPLYESTWLELSEAIEQMWTE